MERLRGNELRQFMHEKGLPYECPFTGNLNSSLMSVRPDSNLVVAAVEEINKKGLTKIRYFSGWYGQDEAEDVARKISRLRKARVYYVNVVKEVRTL